MGELEKFFHDSIPRISPIVKAGLVHVQFETIHPFLNGNGRVGRLLITLLLCEKGLLSQPLLYLSLYFKKNRSTYYELLQNVRTEGDWEAWMRLFLRGVLETTEDAYNTSRALVKLFRDDAELMNQSWPPKGSIYQSSAHSSALRVHQNLQSNPITNLKSIVEETGMHAKTVGNALDGMIEMGLVREVTGKKRNRVYVYSKYLEILQAGTELNQS